MKSFIGVILFLSLSVAKATEPAVFIYPLAGSLYVAEDSHYAKTNYVVYIGAASVTVVGAGWTPDTAELLQKLQQLHLDIDKIISGHWSAVHGAELIDQYLAMLKERSKTGH